MTERFGIAEVLEFARPVVRVVVANVEGSTPREPGAAMFVTKRPAFGVDDLPSNKGACVSLPLNARERGEGKQAGDDLHEGRLPSIEGAWGTIGGGQLEFEAIAHARFMLEAAKDEPNPWRREMRVWPLGPSLGQCCGGSVRVLFELYTDHERASMTDADNASLIVRPAETGEPLYFLSARQKIGDLPLHVARVAKDMLNGARNRKAAFLPARKGTPSYFIEPAGHHATPLYIYGAGHVGRAIVKAIEDLDFAMNWIDTHAERFLDALPRNVRQIVASDPSSVAQNAPHGAFHLVLTYSHPLDFAICHTLLKRDNFGFLGLIGSRSKRQRFKSRFSASGISEQALGRMVCPIGIGNISGKEPATIAIAVAAQLIERQEAQAASRSDERKEETAHEASQPLPA